MFALRSCAFAIPFLMLAPALQGCATQSSAALFDVGTGADADLRALSKRAAAGDKRAQYEMGVRFEEGEGLPWDLGRAERIYRLAASPVGASQIYFPSASGKSGQVKRITNRNVPANDHAAIREKALRIRALPADHVVTFCPAHLAYRGMIGAIRSGALWLKANCESMTSQFAQKMTFRFDVSALQLPDEEFVSLWDPKLLPRQRLSLSDDFKSYNAELSTKTDRCNPLNLRAVASPPVPDDFLDDKGNWVYSIDFLALPRCDVLIAVVGNKAAIVRQDSILKYRAYNIQISNLGSAR